MFTPNGFWVSGYSKLLTIRAGIVDTVHMDNSTLKALGIASVEGTRQANRLDLSACLKDRYHHRLTYQQIADKYGVSKPAVFERLKGFIEKMGDSEELQGFQDVEDKIQAAIKQRYSSHLLNVDIDKLGAKDAAIVYSCIYDKHRLQTGQSTNNQSVFFTIVAESDHSSPVDNPVENSIEDAIVVRSE